MVVVGKVEVVKVVKEVGTEVVEVDLLLPGTVDEDVKEVVVSGLLVDEEDCLKNYFKYIFQVSSQLFKIISYIL